MKARNRVALSTLYLGTGELEERLVKALVENPSKPRVRLLTDATRSTRPIKVTAEFTGALDGRTNRLNCPATPPSPLFLLQRIASLPNARVALYHSHRLRSWLRKILPERLNEVVGLQHIKVYVFDDNVILSGANLSGEYFNKRQDRAWLLKDVPELAAFYVDLIDTISSLSYQVTAEGDLVPASAETDPVLTPVADYCNAFRSRVEAFLAAAKTKYAVPATKAPDTVLVPLLQMGAYGISQEYPLVQRVLQCVSKCEIALTTGYFNPTRELEESLISIAQRHVSDSSVQILCAAPEANSFFKSKGISGGIPAAYREMLISFLRRIIKLPNIGVREYARPGWTFHAKGLWIDTPNASLTLVGSSNYGYRSRDLDLESQLLLVTRNTDLRRRIRAEREHLWDPRYSRPVTLDGLLMSTEQRFKWYAKWALPLLRRIM
uniref:CDP-diacylglycerol--glycerol-3-phosphate 3-phosphatidyltransferase n=1 Tax=Mesocestoides corti TaxID=53468 RepID=A0A5K3ER57_MESCO